MYEPENLYSLFSEQFNSGFILSPKLNCTNLSSRVVLVATCKSDSSAFFSPFHDKKHITAYIENQHKRVCWGFQLTILQNLLA
jgi:hypothetical protein